MSLKIEYLRRYKKRIVQYLLKKQYYKKIHYLIKQHRHKIVKDKVYNRQAKSFWKLKGYNINTNWHMFYTSLNQIKSNQYVPEDLFYNYIERRINNIKLAKAYYDKNMYNKYFKDIKMPRTVIHCIKGNLYNNQYKHINDSYTLQDIINSYRGCFFLKPSLDSGIGKNIIKISIIDGKIFFNGKIISITELPLINNGNFIIQEQVSQSKILNKINFNALNTIRVLSLRVGNEIKILSHIIRFGTEHAYVDNFNAGGIVCSIKENGQLQNYAYNKSYDKLFVHPTTYEAFDQVQLPRFDELKDLIVNCHNRLPYFNIVSWDIGLDELDQYILIEYNLKAQALNFHQVLNGPIFNNYIDDIII